MKKSTIRTIKTIVVLLVFSLVLSCLLWNKFIFPYKFRLGERSFYNYTTNQEIKVVDRQATEKTLKKAKEKLVEKYLQHPPLIQSGNDVQSAMLRLQNTIAGIDGLYSDRDLSVIGVEQDKLSIYSGYTKSDWFVVKSYVTPLAQSLLDFGYIGNVHKSTIQYLLPEGVSLSSTQLALMQLVIVNSLPPTLSIDFKGVDRLVEQDLLSVEKIYKVLPEKYNIIKKGDIVTYDKYYILEQIRANQHKIFHLNVWFEGLIYTLIFSALFVLYCRIERFYFTTRQALLFMTIFLISGTITGFIAFNKIAFLPLSIIVMMISIFTRPSLGLVGGVLFTILSYLALQGSSYHLIPSCIAMIIAGVICRHANNRADIIQGSIYLAFGQMVSYCILSILVSGITFSVAACLQYMVSGFVSSFLVVFSLPFLESLFSVVNRFKLRELSDLEQPILLRMRREAPGTFEHTLIVADLATHAARKLNLDPDLVRVGVLYHDIGKLYQANIFIENQFDGYNPHLEMTYEESAKAIIKHVSEGVRMAQDLRLPDAISIFIPTHQGTALAGHFFHKAQEEDPELDDDTCFRYPGPKPINKETGVVMLADTVEATIRSLKTDNREKVKQVIRKMIDARIHSGQLDNSGLNESDFNILEEAFFECWKNKNHERIQYEVK